MSDPQNPRLLRVPQIAAVLGMAGVLLLAWRLGIFHHFADPARAKQTLLGLGPWGYLAFVAAYAILQPFGVPGTVFIMVAPLVWPWPVAFLLSMAGTMAASLVGFSFARFVARDLVAARIPARFRQYDEALARRAFATVFLLRLIFWMPPMLHAFFGVSKVRFSTHLWGSLLGYILPVLAVSYFGQRLFDMMKAVPLAAWIGLFVGVGLVAFIAWRARSARAKRITRARTAAP